VDRKSKMKMKMIFIKIGTPIMFAHVKLLGNGYYSIIESTKADTDMNYQGEILSNILLAKDDNEAREWLDENLYSKMVYVCKIFTDNDE
jgi:hypothetical protein